MAGSERESGAPRGGRPPEKRLVLVWSDGAVLDSERPAHELCLGPAFAECFCEGCESREAAGLWSSVALDSRLRGASQFRILAAALRLAARRPSLGRAARKETALAAALEAWLATENRPSPERLELALQSGDVDPRLYKALEWSWQIQTGLASLPPPPPFAAARTALGLIAGEAMIIALSSRPPASVKADWARAGIAGLAGGYARARRGSAESLASILEACRPETAALLVGDAALDIEWARSAGAAFYPIFRERVDGSWEDLAQAWREGRAASEGPAIPVAAFLDSFAAAPGRAGGLLNRDRR